MAQEGSSQESPTHHWSREHYCSYVCSYVFLYLCIFIYVFVFLYLCIFIYVFEFLYLCICIKKVQVRCHPHIIGQENTSRPDDDRSGEKAMKKEMIEKLWDLWNRTQEESQESHPMPHRLIVNAGGSLPSFWAAVEVKKPS